MSNTITVDAGYLAALEYELRKMLREKYRNQTGRDYCNFVIGAPPVIRYTNISQPDMPVVRPDTYTITVNMNEI